jgi:hypothetical protein
MNGGERNSVNSRKYVYPDVGLKYNPKLFVIITPSTSNGYTEKVYIAKLRLVQH